MLLNNHKQNIIDKEYYSSSGKPHRVQWLTSTDPYPPGDEHFKDPARASNDHDWRQRDSYHLTKDPRELQRATPLRQYGTAGQAPRPRAVSRASEVSRASKFPRISELPKASDRAQAANGIAAASRDAFSSTVRSDNHQQNPPGHQRPRQTPYVDQWRPGMPVGQRRRGMSSFRPPYPSSVAMDKSNLRSAVVLPQALDSSPLTVVPSASSSAGKAMGETTQQNSDAQLISLGLRPAWCITLTLRNARPGMIICGAIHEQDYHPPGWVAGPDDKFTTLTRYGNVFSKVRPQIIIAVLTQHVMCLPLYTHSGRGLDAKPDATKDEFVSVRDRRHGSFEALSGHRPLDTIPRRESPLMHTMTVAHATYPVNRKYDLPVEYLGDLKQASLEYLVDLAKASAFNGVGGKRNP